MSRLQLQIFFGIILTLITSLVLIYSGLNEEQRMARYELGHEAQAIEVGAGLFENNCRGCHGNQGEGIAGLCPPLNSRDFFTERLKEVGWSGSLEDYIISTVSAGRLVSTRPDQFVGNGRPAMPAWSEAYGGPLREDQIRDLAKFILNWESSALGQYEPVEVASPVSDDPVVRGQTVFNTYGCGGCHTVEGLSSGITGPNQTHIGTDAATRVEGYSAEQYIRESILNPNAYVVEGYNPDIMPKNFGDLMDEEELNDLVAFLLAQK